MTVPAKHNHADEPVLSGGKKDPPVRSRIRKSALPYVLTFIILFAVWILLSGRFDLFHLLLGVISCALVSAVGHEMLFPSLKIKRLPTVWFRFIRYIPWLLYQVLVANIRLMVLSFHPRMLDLIDPGITVYKSRLKSDLALVTLANSITLTPGTVTVYVSIFGDVTFHAIDAESRQSVPGMNARVAEIFGEQ